ncbi:MAG: glucan biosynthesis protein, partial [Gemmatimonadaceae bacterium]|nr:glucan biosynthesis protein [Acetobacteraceae bacterium]
GAGTAPGTRVFVLDFQGEAVKALPAGAKTLVELGTSAGRVAEGYSAPNPETGGWRISIAFDPAGADVAELRCVLRDARDDRRAALSETWLYRWTA